MIALIQRVAAARVEVDGQVVGAIDSGLLVLVGVAREDREAQAQRLAERICAYRVFGDGADRMNLSVTDVNGGVLLVPQFTLAANTAKGNRASFTSAAEPKVGKLLFDSLVAETASRIDNVESGRFGAHMRVHSINDGPVTFWLEARASAGHG